MKELNMSKLKVLNDKPTSSDVYHHFTEIKNENWKKWEETFDEKYKEYRYKFENYPKTLTVPDTPIHIDNETSSKCHLSCVFCPRTEPVQKGLWREEEHMEFSLFKKIIDEAANIGVYSINLNFLGEPLLNPKLPDFIQYAKKKGILDVFLHTSGTPMGEKKLKAIMTSGLDKLAISFDSPYKKKYEEVRVNASYEKTLENIKKISEYKKRTGQIKPLTRINFIKLPGTTQEEINDLIKLFSPLVDSIGLLDYVDPLKAKSAQIKDGHISKWVCPQILTRLMIYQNGNIHPCCSDYNNELKLGSIQENGLMGAWNSGKLKYIRQKHLEGKFYEIPACRNCEFAIQGDLKSQIEVSMFENMV